MSAAPAAELARVKAAHPQWSIRKADDGKGTGYTARHRVTGERVRGRTLVELVLRMSARS